MYTFSYKLYFFEQIIQISDDIYKLLIYNFIFYEYICYFKNSSSFRNLEIANNKSDFFLKILLKYFCSFFSYSL